MAHYLNTEPLNLSPLLSGKAVSFTSFTKNGTFASWKLFLLGVEKVSYVSLSYRSTEFKSDKCLKIPVRVSKTRSRLRSNETDVCKLELLCTHDEGFRPQFEMAGFQVDAVKQRYTETKGGILSVRINGLSVLSGLNLEEM